MCNCSSSGGLVRGGQSYPDCDPCCVKHKRFDKAKKNLKQYQTNANQPIKKKQ